MFLEVFLIFQNCINFKYSVETAIENLAYLVSTVSIVKF